jgi:hypothetical protein
MLYRFVNLSRNFRLSGAPHLSGARYRAQISRPTGIEEDPEEGGPAPDIQVDEDEDWNSGDFGGWPVVPANLD